MKNRQFPRRQDGAALITVIVLLLVMTILGLFSVRATVMEERMSAGMLDRSLAFQSAEAALVEGERRALLLATFPAMGTCINGVCGPPNQAATPVWEVSTVWQAAPAVAASFEGTAGAPRYIIEMIASGVPAFAGAGECSTAGDVSGSDCTVTGVQRRFRITARSGTPASSDGRAVVILQSILAANGASPP
jgi:type IV pilus assembly protein PilX